MLRAPRAARPSRTSADAGIGDPVGKCGAKLGGVVRRQVDFVHHTIEGERDCFIGRDAVDIIDIVDEKRLESSNRAQDVAP